MISISQLAASVLLKTLKECEVEVGQSLRLAKGKKGLVLQLDEPVETDRVIRYKGVIVLIVKKALENELGDARIDVEDTEEGRELMIRRHANPNEISSKISNKYQYDNDKGYS